MNLSFAYLGRSSFEMRGQHGLLNFAPNLRRDRVAFDAPLLKPLRFREAVSALHDVVVSDLRFKPRDKSAYEAWKKAEAQRERSLRRSAVTQAKAAILEKRAQVPPDFERAYNAERRVYWDARQEYSSYLRAHDLELWRALMPCDPVITVADDVLFFECFSADESAYGCLTVDRGRGFGAAAELAPGTTNVDYSWDLFHHFQALRSYRETRFRIDPAGFEVLTKGSGDGIREEKIDLPDGWLRGFLQLQGAMSLPMKTVTISPESLYSLLAWLRRHKERKSPRALRFELLPGKATRLVMEPWDLPVVSRGTYYDGPETEPIRVWGKRRLLVLARLLPLIDRVDVHLLGTGLPSFWVAHMGEMRFTLGLSGWTANDWTRGSSLDLLAPPASPPPSLIQKVSALLFEKRALTPDQIQSATGDAPANVAAALLTLAHTGQAITDLGAGLVRWRQVMPMPVAMSQLGPPSAEFAAAQALVPQMKLEKRDDLPDGGALAVGNWGGKSTCELFLDRDERIRRGKCSCSHHFRYGLRKGPCRHLLALRFRATNWKDASMTPTWASTFERLTRWAKR